MENFTRLLRLASWVSEIVGNGFSMTCAVSNFPGVGFVIFQLSRCFSEKFVVFSLSRWRVFFVAGGLAVQLPR